MKERILALAQGIVVFAFTLNLIVVVGTSPAAACVREFTHRIFHEHSVMIAVPLLILAAFYKQLTRARLDF